ncbi:M48 family metallopeptidase [Stutzerimonas kirkiae]|uniref:Peptidase M48 n=1 Tax=Stutzerimonas kirkiae TaxID=2211392 RepID=A0A4Q9RBB3_9GAMM|nr:M48 family metallopeptidase [Stutzerimonas kirkiae]TBU98128.1 peptidase M48 [Stutzerimonas kirkiae]TBV02357.1 peptidase M48 [Stutzerimonas kirkiae]TBV11180.1 peptidase M48 [Stutzerimonas kirkiae]TBV14668.1 peptidase M48 [Stutzerimonas kirkiae]
MRKPQSLPLLVGAALLVGCQAVNTTSGGSVGVERKQYMFSMVSTEQVNQMYAESYQETLAEASKKGLLKKNDALTKRVDGIARRLIAEVPAFRADASQWDWQVNVIDSPELNANCGPGGKIIFYSGLIEQLKLTDDEIAAVMGHEIAHALREHGREAMSKAYGLQMANQLGAAFGIGDGSLQLANVGVQYLMTLPNSRSNENEADLIGLELSARAGYDPNAAVTLWQKMAAAGGSSTPEFMSTHPSPANRTETLQTTIPKVMPLYEASKKR